MQTVDFVALATRVSGGAEGIRACLVQSREGLTLGAYPLEAEPRLREAWRGLQALGDARRGFVDTGEEIVVVSRRGPYVGLALASPDVRPGLVLDILDSHLASAEHERAGGTSAVVPDEAPRAAPARRRRPSRHAAAARRGQPREVELPVDSLARALEPAATASESEAVPVAELETAPSVVQVPEPAAEHPLGRRLGRLAGGSPATAERQPFEEAMAGPPQDRTERPVPPQAPEAPRVDRAALAREFGRLLSRPAGEQE